MNMLSKEKINFNSIEEKIFKEMMKLGREIEFKLGREIEFKFEKYKKFWYNIIM